MLAARVPGGTTWILHTLERLADERAGVATPSLVLLLTDGKETTGVIDPMDAAKMAAEESIRVYTIFAGAKYNRVFSHLSQRGSKVPVDPGPLPAMAKLTGARFFHASDAVEL